MIVLPKKTIRIQDGMDAVLKAAINDETNIKADAMNYFGISNFRTHRILEKPGRIRKKWKDNVFEIAKKGVDEFAHGEECTRIDTNQFKLKKVGNVKHPIRTWNHVHWSRRLVVVNRSNACEKHKNQFPSLAIGKIRFRKSTCP